MTIKQNGGVFGRNPTFNDLTVEGTLEPGTLSGYAIGTDVQAYDAGLTSIAGLTTDADKMIYTTAADTYSITDLTAAGRAILDDADASAQRTTLGLAIGTDVQAHDAGLDSIAGLTTAADKMIYTTASDTYAVTDITSAGRAILDDADAAAQRTTLGLGTIATQDADSVNIDGGAIDGTVIGENSISDAYFGLLRVDRSGGGVVYLKDSGATQGTISAVSARNEISLGNENGKSVAVYRATTGTVDAFTVRSNQNGTAYANMKVLTSGDVQNTGNSYGAISDVSLKENISDANSQWSDIKALQVRNYNLITQPDKTHIGVIAQELESAGMNGLVEENDDGLKTVKYSILYMKAVKALQEAMDRIEQLEQRVSDLEA